LSDGVAGALRVGLVGCGRVARTYLDALGKVPGCRLVGLADVVEPAAQELGARHGVPAYAGGGRLLESASPDAVIVCTPPATHPEVAGFFLDHGVHVLCEKPLALRSADAEVLVARAEAAGRVLMMASKFRYVEDVIRAADLVASGRLGEVVLYENVFCSRVDMRGRWNSDPVQAGGGVLVDNGTHSVDIARYLIGPIVKVQAEEGRRLQGLDVEDTCRLHLRSASGVMGAIDLSWSIHKERDAYIELFGSEGVVSIGWKRSKYRLGEGADWVVFGDGYDKLAAFARQLDNFVSTIRGTEAPRISAAESIESVRVIEAAYRSMRRDDWVSVATGAKTGS
jgi:predicted dehydrogenase